jgi:surface polysaccharide O-acyltransferase-like enzyme
MSTQTEKIQYFDTLRALATVAVIIIHVSSPVLKMTYLREMDFWWIGNIFNSFTRFAVPMFLMLSGATLLNKSYSLSEFYKKRLVRVFIPLIFWMTVYWLYRWTMLSPKLQPHTFNNISRWAVDLFLNEGVSKHLWYVYMILFLYIFIPFISKIVQKASNKYLLIFLFVWIVLCMLTYNLNLSFYIWTGDYQYKLLGYLEYSGFLILGYFLSQIKLDFKGNKSIYFLAYLITVAISALVAYFVSKHDHQLNLRIYSYFSLNTIIQTVALFMFIKEIHIKNKILEKITTTISAYSYGIYLVHIIVIGVLFRNGIYWSFANPLISLPLLTVFVLISSWLIIYLIRKIPGGKYVSG